MYRKQKLALQKKHTFHDFERQDIQDFYEKNKITQSSSDILSKRKAIYISTNIISQYNVNQYKIEISYNSKNEMNNYISQRALEQQNLNTEYCICDPKKQIKSFLRQQQNLSFYNQFEIKELAQMAQKVYENEYNNPINKTSEDICCKDSEISSFIKENIRNHTFSYNRKIKISEESNLKKITKVIQKKNYFDNKVFENKIRIHQEAWKLMKIENCNWKMIKKRLKISYFQLNQLSRIYNYEDISVILRNKKGQKFKKISFRAKQIIKEFVQDSNVFIQSNDIIKNL